MSRVISHPIDDHFTFRTMTIEDLRLALSWAKEEGWNPGIEDAVNFFGADPRGFFLGEIDGEPISCISVVKYPETFNFVGFILCGPNIENKDTVSALGRRLFDGFLVNRPP
jgi:hypothetical protein